MHPFAPESAVGDAAVVFLQDSFADPQPQPGSFCRLGAEERLEEVSRIFRLDANARVDDRDADAARCVVQSPRLPDMQAARSPPFGMA